MRDQEGFQQYNHWYRGNLHCHSTLSDGHMTPEEVIRYHKDNGYDFLCLSDHDRYADFRADYDTDSFIMLPGMEYSAILYSEDGKRRFKMHHMHAILGTEEMQRKAAKPPFSHLEHVQPVEKFGGWDGAEVAQQLSDMMRERGMLVTYNHPVWSRVTEEEFVHTTGLWALEIYNYDTDIECALGTDTVHWDNMLRRGKHIWGFASDDNHNNPKMPDSFGGWIMVNAPELTHEAILSNMISGNFYATGGPQITAFGVKNDKVYVDCSPVQRVNFIVGNEIGDGATIGCGQFQPGCRPHENTLTHAELPLKGREDYVRIECVDQWGATAWTNPLYLKD